MPKPSVSESLLSFAGLSALILCLTMVAVRNSGINMPENLRAYRQAMAGLQTGMEEKAICRSFRRMPAVAPNYTVGVTAISDHQPYFGGRAYRVYDLGYFDMDRRLILMALIICEDEKITRIEPATYPRPPD